MAKVVKRHWVSDAGSGLPRKDRRSCCDYEAYLPDPLVDREVVLDGRVAADVSEAEAALVRFGLEAGALSDSEALARLLLRSESVASSRSRDWKSALGGCCRRRLPQIGRTVNDVTAGEVLGNIDAMVFAIKTVGEGDVLTVELLLETHRRLLLGTRLETDGGELRRQQNWIGGSSFNPCSAEFVPPPLEVVPGPDATCASSATTHSLPAVAQAAVAHAQFETIHPFVDGNGREDGLVHLVLRRRSAVTRVLPPGPPTRLLGLRSMSTR